MIYTQRRQISFEDVMCRTRAISAGAHKGAQRNRCVAVDGYCVYLCASLHDTILQRGEPIFQIFLWKMKLFDISQTSSSTLVHSPDTHSCPLALFPVCASPISAQSTDALVMRL